MGVEVGDILENGEDYRAEQVSKRTAPPTSCSS